MYLQEHQQVVSGGRWGGEGLYLWPNAPRDTKVRPDAGRSAVLLLPILLITSCVAYVLQ